MSKSGEETFTVKLEPVLVDICPVCQKVTSLPTCTGHDPRFPHDSTPVPNGDRSFFKDIPQGEIFLTPLTPEAGAAFEVGKITTVSFELED